MVKKNYELIKNFVEKKKKKTQSRKMWKEMDLG